MNGELQLADTANLFLVSYYAPRELVVIGPMGGNIIQRREALNMAAWIVALVDPEEKEFKPLLEAIKAA
jgi:hypothetical protein